MSWNFEFTARSKTTAKQRVTEEQSRGGPHFPPVAAEAVVRAIDMLPDRDDAAVVVKTHGHIDAVNGSVEISAKLLNLV